MHFVESICLRLDLPPWNAILRVVLGWFLFPSYTLLCKGKCPEWLVLPAFGMILIALRVVPLFFRKALPFSSEAQSLWSARRQLAKTYDSYQWRKLFWIGLGMTFSLFYQGETEPYKVFLSGFCAFGGAVGLVTWSMISRKIPALAASAS